MNLFYKLNISIIIGCLSVCYYACGQSSIKSMEAVDNQLLSREVRIKKSSNFKNGKVVNLIPTEKLEKGSFFKLMFKSAMGGGQKHQKVHRKDIPMHHPVINSTAAKGLEWLWLGHSSLVVDIEEKRIVIDPVFSKRVSMFQWLGPKRYMESPVIAEELGNIDAVVISHDHYDHLDKQSILDLAPQTNKFVVPLGVGADLERWGVDQSKIVELDWWEGYSVEGIKFTCTPARHFSGRGLSDRDKALFASWVFTGEEFNVYYSGDTGFFEEFKQIGQEYGPFDLSFIQIGAYDAMWKDVHMYPEEGIKANELLGAEVMVPVHWGSFDLSYHSWHEPVDRLYAQKDSVDFGMIFPRHGYWQTLSDSTSKWWDDLVEN